MKLIRLCVVAPMIALACLGGSANAQEYAVPREAMRFDDRYHLDQYYPSQGYLVSVLPRAAFRVAYGRRAYYYHAGVWYQLSAGRYVVVLPPPGIVTPVLPPAYVSLAIGGVPYYYANGTYYVTTPGQGYAVVAPPPGVELAQPTAVVKPPAVAHDLIAYPRNGQTAAQVALDRQECYAWAAAQPSSATDPRVLHRALTACMDGRGYTVR